MDTTMAEESLVSSLVKFDALLSCASPRENDDNEVFDEESLDPDSELR